jgi:hypothetical protein
MSRQLSRRDFLALGALATGGLALRPAPPARAAGFGLGRVTVDWIGLYSEPSLKSTALHRYTRDTLLNLLQRETSDDGPRHNPIWYRLDHGYVHSGHVQLVHWKPQLPQRHVLPTGQLFEVSVPLTRSHREPDPASAPLYRLYYQSTAWVTEVVDGADGRRWYRVLDDLIRVHFYVRAEHLRLVPATELEPISPETPLHHKRILVDLPQQEMFCYERERLVFRTRISSGIPDDRPRDNGIPTITPTGSFFVELKTPVRHMGDGNLTADLRAYELPGVPWVSFFTTTGVAFHGTYWHNDFGRPKSHGCVNMRTEEAKWLYRWSLPVVSPDQIRRIARGTPILIV